MATIDFPMHGWLPHGSRVEWERDDQGKDVSVWPYTIQAPGNGFCVHNLSDRPFPNGFGPSYPVVYIESGAFGGHYWYLGHTTSAVQSGERFGFGHVLAHANQGINFEGTHGGWMELGEAPGGFPGPNQGQHWFDRALESPLIEEVPDRNLHLGDAGHKVMMLTGRLQHLGLLHRRFWRYNEQVKQAIEHFQRQHRLHPSGEVDGRTWIVLKHAAEAKPFETP